MRLTCDCPLPEPVERLAVRDPDPAVLAEFLERMEFRTFARRIGDGKIEAKAPGSTPAPALHTPPAAPQPGAQVFDHEAYECVQSLEALDRWIERAFTAGVIGFDTETDALSSSHANLCGLSIATGANEACYVPLGHCAEEGLQLMGDASSSRSTTTRPCAGSSRCWRARRCSRSARTSSTTWP